MTRVIVATNETTPRPEFAGWMWVPLQFVLGLRRLGVDVTWVDRVGSIDPYQGPHTLDYVVQRFGRTAAEFGLEGAWSIVVDGGRQHCGMTKDELGERIAGADILLNLGGHLPEGDDLQRVPRRAYIDVDPGYTQIWATERDIGLDRHNVHFTVGQNVDRPDFAIPVGDRQWHTFLPPVVLDQWPAMIDERAHRFSTVADWRGSQDAIFGEEYYGTKRSEFIRFLRTPVEAGQRVEIALCIGQRDYEDLGLLDGHAWRVRDPYQYAGDLYSYREFIQYSRAEFSVAKAGYVKANAGWISDRTACYLASGKPAIVQSTGFEWKLPPGKGLLTYRTPDEAVAAIRAVNEDYLSHARAARELAAEHFDSDDVLRSMLQRAAG